MNGLFAKWILLNIQPYHFFSSWRVWTRLSEFWYLCPTVSVIIRDKVGNFGQFDDRTLFENESNLHTKVAFTHNISRWTHNLWPVVSIPAVQWSTHSVFSVLAGQKVEIWWNVINCHLTSVRFCGSPLGRKTDFPHLQRAIFYRPDFRSAVCPSMVRGCGSNNNRELKHARFWVADGNRKWVFFLF